MFQIIDRDRHHLPVKSGFKTPGQALKWAKKNLGSDSCPNWGKLGYGWRYYIQWEGPK